MERAQQKVEGRNFDIRKTLIKFDDVMNDQRQVIFGQRLKILKSENISETYKSFLDEVILDLIKVKNEYEKNNDKTI
jgi:preprotein translocase subunit SecA